MLKNWNIKLYIKKNVTSDLPWLYNVAHLRLV